MWVAALCFSGPCTPNQTCKAVSFPSFQATTGLASWDVGGFAIDGHVHVDQDRCVPGCPWLTVQSRRDQRVKAGAMRKFSRGTRSYMLAKTFGQRQ